MKSVVVYVSIVLLGCAAILAQNTGHNSGQTKGKRVRPSETTQQAAGTPGTANSTRAAVEKGATWLASVQGADGGWGQD